MTAQTKPNVRLQVANASSNAAPPARGTRADAPPVDAETRGRVVRVLDAIRPTIQADGGDVELVEITPEGVVGIRLHGACVGCPSSTMTLQMGIERNLRDHVPEVTGVRAVD